MVARHCSTRRKMGSGAGGSCLLTNNRPPLFQMERVAVPKVEGHSVALGFPICTEDNMGFQGDIKTLDDLLLHSAQPRWRRHCGVLDRET